MRFSSLLVLVLALPLSSVACKKKSDDTKSSSSQDDDGKKKKSTKDESDDDGEASAKKKKKGSKACKAPESPITADFTFPEGCELELEHELVVQEGATVTIEPGVKLSFPPGSRLDVDHGKLVAKGTDDAPIVLTSKSSSPSAGEWEGVILRGKTTAGTVLDHVVVEYGGAASWGHGGITLTDVPAGRVSITSSKVRHNATAGLHADSDKTAFVKFEGNTFEDNAKTSLRIQASTLGSVGKNKLGEPVKIGGNVTKTQTWPKLDVPIHVVEHVRIGGEEEAAILTLADDTVLKFSPEQYLWIGADKGGALVSKGATFTSVNASPAEGDWEGLIIDEKANQTKITDCVIEYAGYASYGHGGVTFQAKTAKEMKGVKIEGCTFKNVKHGGIWSSDHDCGPFASGNEAKGGALCAKAE